MGGSQSGARTVTVENNLSAIDVSEEVVQRLKFQLKSKKEEEQRAKAAAVPSPAADNNQKNDFIPPTAVPKPMAVTPASPSPLPPPPEYKPSSYPNPPQPPSIVYSGEPTITAIEVRRQKNKELEANDEYWKKRLNQLEESMKHTTSIREKEYASALENVRSHFNQTPAQFQVRPCQDLKSKLIACYKQHPNESLMCAKEVDDFIDCINTNRMNILNERKKTSDQKVSPVAASTTTVPAA